MSTKRTKANQKKKKQFVNLKALKERSWTQSKIDLWLKEPDRLIDNPFYRSGPPQKLYLLTRVKLQEKNKRFQDWL